jgi:hypothetical protein
MRDIFDDLAALYRDAFTETLRSLKRAWIGVVAIYVYAVALRLVETMVGMVPQALVAGLLLSLADAVAVGAVLALLQRAVGRETLGMIDVRDAVGAYVWNVLAVGFILWLPFALLAQVAPLGVFAGASLLAAVFLNPLPEVIYQTRGASPLEDLGESARFVQQQWIEWFLPILIVAAPLSAIVFAAPESTLVLRGGLSFGRFLLLPTLLVYRVTALLGIPLAASAWLVQLGTPVLSFALLLFRGHLFAALSGSSRRQRLFRRRVAR